MIKITTDSTCDLPRELLERYNITVTPLGIVKAGKLYQDGVDIRTADIAAHVDAGGEITTTNAVNVADYEALFRRLMERVRRGHPPEHRHGLFQLLSERPAGGGGGAGGLRGGLRQPDGGPRDAGAGRRRGGGGRASP